MADQEKIDYKARAEELGAAVTREDGRTDIPPTQGDYQRAVEAMEAAAAGAVIPPEGEAVEKTFEVVGPFPVLGTDPGGTFTGKVDEAGVLHSGGQALNAAALLESGALKEKKA